MIIGLAGKSCSGKNIVSQILDTEGFITIDMDIMAHETVSEETDALSQLFGSTIIKEDGQIDRTILGSLVFSDPRKLKKLENFLYPILHRKLEEYIRNRENDKHIVINAAALQKGDFWERCDHILWIESPFLLRLLRALKRDNQGLSNILKRFSAQKELKAQYFFSRVDTYIIRNDSTLTALCKRVEKWIKIVPAER